MTHVSIITRTKNRPVLLKRALESVAKQSFTDYTQVVVNDAGDLAPVQALIDAMEEGARSRVRLIDNPVSSGREAAMNIGLEALDATAAPYFAIHDDDDSWEADFLERTVKYLDEHPQDVAVSVRTDLIHEVVEGEAIREVNREILAGAVTQMSLIETLIQNYAPPISQLLRRVIADEVGHWDGRLPVLADWEFNLRMLSKGPMGFIDGAPLAHWHHRTTLDEDLGNSIVTDATSHNSYNVTIRDDYLRAALRPGQLADLSTPLLIAELYRRLSEQSAHQYADRTRANEAIHADLVKALLAQNEEISQLKTSLDELHKAIGPILEMSLKTLNNTDVLVDRGVAGALKKVLGSKEKQAN
ncbi:MAG: glycosyltransferase family 2 protein [Actinomycetaceae bacterium]|nr:glycosyltransferase family 2 protein [Actinomycetaceae bacterium]